MNLWLWWAQQFQTAIVGAIGFLGVVLTLVINAKIARDDRLASALHERGTLRAALLEELRMLLNMYNGNAESCADVQRQNPKPGPDACINVPAFSMTDIYDASISKLGILTGDEVRKVLHAYMVHRQKLYVIASFLGETTTGTNISISAATAGLLQGVFKSATSVVIAEAVL